MKISGFLLKLIREKTLQFQSSQKNG